MTEMQTYVVPPHEHLKTITSWVVARADGPTLGIVRFVGLYEEFPRRIVTPPAIVYGPPLREITSQGASMEEEVTVTIEQQEQRQVAQSLLRTTSLEIGVPNLLAGLPDLMVPHAAALRGLRESIKAKFSREATESRSLTTTASRTVERRVKISISEAQDEELVVLPQYHRYEFSIYLSYIDYLLLDYSRGKKRCLPRPDAPNRTMRRLFSRGRNVRNELHFNMQIGRVEFYKYVDPKIVYKRNLPDQWIDPQVSSLYLSTGAGTNAQPTLPPSLYEIAKCRQLPRYAHQVRAELERLGTAA